VNDGSPDTPALETVLQPLHDRITYLAQPNGGPGAARNLGIRNARAELIAFLDSDDVWFPEYLAEQMKVFNTQPAPDVVAADMSTYGNPHVSPTTLTTRHDSAQKHISLRDLLLLDYVLLPSSTVARKSTLLNAGLFDESITRGEDWDLWMRIAHQGGRIIANPHVLGRRHVHAGGLTRAMWETRKDEVRILKKWKQTPDLAPHIQQLLEEKFAQVSAYIDLEEGKSFLKSGDITQATAALERAYGFFGEPKLQERAMSTGPVTQGRMHVFLRRSKLRLLLAGLRYFPSVIAFTMRKRTAPR
jgi:glycosyltransferase involved in cell wall biosynthesis